MNYGKQIPAIRPDISQGNNPWKNSSSKMNIDYHTIVLINVYDPNNDDVSFFDKLYDFL